MRALGSITIGQHFLSKNYMKSKIETAIATVLGLSFMVAGMSVIPMGYKELKNAQDSLKWPATDGVIISSEIKENKDEDSTTYEANVRYEFSVEKKLYSSDNISFGQYSSSDPEHARQIVRRYPKGQKVSVNFNPTHPNESVLEPGVTYVSYLPLVIGVVFFGVGAAILGFFTIVSPILRRKRTEVLKKAASNLDMAFSEEDKMLEQEIFLQFPLFQRGYSRKIKNILYKNSATGKTILFDYDFKEGSGENSSQYCQTVAAFHVPNRNLPLFSLRPENVFDKVGEFFGQQDIDFESYPEFSKSYRLQGELELAIREVFNFEVLQFFSQNPGWWLEGGGEWLVIYKLARRVQPEELGVFLQEATQISELFSH